MKVVIAIDSFKGSMTSQEVSSAIEKGIKEVFSDSDIIKVPIADGGEGTVDILIEGLGGTIIEKEVFGPLMKKVNAKYGILNDGTCIIEMASASGLPLLNEGERNPLYTTTYGVGELVIDAISNGCRDFIIGIGGSATNDLGIGMMQALGFRFFDESGQELDGIGKSLNHIKRIDDSLKLKELENCHFLIACDVDNPLFGKNGAAHVYARQKGADDDMIEILDQGLRNMSDVIMKSYNKDVANLSGAGAAGGLGAGICTFLNGELKSGIEIIFDKIQIEDKVKGADILITGEGKMDFQSVMGKLPQGIAHLGKKHKIPVIGIAGAVMDDAYKLHDHGLTSIFSIMNYPMSLEDAMNKNTALKLIEKNTIEIFRLIRHFKLIIK